MFKFLIVNPHKISVDFNLTAVSFSSLLLLFFVSTVPLSGFVKTTIDVLHYAGPNLSVFDGKAMAANSLPVSSAYILSITLYAFVYSGILAGAATFIFGRRNFS